MSRSFKMCLERERKFHGPIDNNGSLFHQYNFLVLFFILSENDIRCKIGFSP